MNLDRIFITIAGSRLYGTNHENSDYDKRGVCYDPIDTMLGLNSFEQSQDFPGEEDMVVYGLRKFCKLALEANPNITELLFVNRLDKETCLYAGTAWYKLMEVRNAFLSKKCIDSFCGYATSQLKKMKAHYEWLTKDEPVKPNPEDYGMYINSKGSNQWSSQERKEEYQNLLKHYNQYQNWIENRNPERYELEKKYGYDTKDAMHLIRLQEQGMELMCNGWITLPRPNAKELIQIRNGKYTYDEIIELSEYNFNQIKILEENSILPNKPDFQRVNGMVMDINRRYITENWNNR